MAIEREQSPSVSTFTRYGPEGSVLKLEKIGNKPSAFFVAGIHGDEHEVIDLVRKTLDEKIGTAPHVFGSHARVLEAHPKAISLKSRKAGDIDLNRQFVGKERPDHPQAKLLADCFLEHSNVHTVFSFHEDPEEDRFYLYHQAVRDDAGEMDTYIETLIDRLVSRVESEGISLYDGIDDIDLGYLVKRGFCAVASDAMHDNTFEMWALQKNLHNHPNIRRTFLFEIPGKLSAARKEAVVRMIMDEFVEPYMENISSTTKKNNTE